MKDLNGDKSMSKHGPGSGITFGKGSRLSLYTRRIWEGREIKSREWGVIGITARSDVNTSPVFSSKGDSGACVADAYGRISGIITGGAGFREGVPDVTYVTPIHLITEALHSTKTFQYAQVYE
ncbi:hypothetical protein TWF506_003482 [Arthrobotrys conoides]|uniref:Peptidase S1 domain-containing protein n=1 Tax=Arthrobotrys conoides TaxID=74498 RepID=A0AAN8RQC5_9PEZI